MEINYTNLIRNLKQRSNPENINESTLFDKSFTDDLSLVTPNSVLEYIKRAMGSVGELYTKRSKDAGEKVKDHLRECLSEVSYRYQGSVMTNTHIRGSSDIDLLVICDKFYSYNNFAVNYIMNNNEQQVRLQNINNNAIDRVRKVYNEKKYEGNPNQDLMNIRLKSERKLSFVYNICDITKPKAIKITNQNLYRDVDIVVASWYDDIRSIIFDGGDYRSIQIYNKHEDSRGRVESPFLSIKRVNERDVNVNGRLKKMIRFLKNIKMDSQKDIALSSFDINAICYNIEPGRYKTLDYLRLVLILFEEFSMIAGNEEYRNSIKSVDGSEDIFKGNDGKIKAFLSLFEFFRSVFGDVKVRLN